MSSPANNALKRLIIAVATCDRAAVYIHLGFVAILTLEVFLPAKAFSPAQRRIKHFVPRLVGF
jgi:hypothetical protein